MRLRLAATLRMGCVSVAIFAACAAHGQDDGFKVKAGATSIGFVQTTMKQDGLPDLKSNWGLSLTKSHSYYIGKPLAGGRLRLGVDVAFTDINYTNYKIDWRFPTDYWEYASPDDNEWPSTIHELEIGIQAGLGVNYSITRLLNLHATARYVPCFAGMYDGDDFSGAFGNFGVAGLTVNYGMIGLGLEYRFGGAKYKSLLSLSDLDSEEGESVRDSDRKIKTTFSGLRALVVLHF